MLQISNIISKIKHFVNSLYYFKHSISKNTYPYKLIGEKIYHIEPGKIILYKVLGQQSHREIPLQTLLNNKRLVEKFHPVDAAKLGSLAFEEIIFSLKNHHRESKFNQIKNTMLNSTHDIHAKKELELNQFQPVSWDQEPSDDYLDIAVMKNIYSCKLVGCKANRKMKATTIIFTILGKRDGYERSLQELLYNKELLEKFHPTEAVKFGFIFSGDSLFFVRNKESNLPTT